LKRGFVIFALAAIDLPVKTWNTLKTRTWLLRGVRYGFSHAFTQMLIESRGLPCLGSGSSGSCFSVQKPPVMPKHKLSPGFPRPSQLQVIG